MNYRRTEAHAFTFMDKPFYHKVKIIPFEGAGSAHPLAFKHYNPAEIIDGKTLKEQLNADVAPRFCSII